MKRERDMIREVETMKNQRNVTSDEIAKLKKSGIDAKDQIAQLRELGRAIGAIEQDLRTVENDWG